MAGIVNNLIEKIIQHRSKGNETVAMAILEKIAVQLGQPLESFTPESSDDNETIDKIIAIGTNLGLDLRSYAENLRGDSNRVKTSPATESLWGYTDESSPIAAAAKLREIVHGGPGGLLIYFASSSYQPEALSWAIKKEFWQSKVIGCTTAGELSPAGLTKNSLVGLFLPSSYLHGVELAVVTELGKGAAGAGKAVTYLAKKFGKKPLELDPKEFVGIVLPDGLSGGEEELMIALGGVTDAPFVGGSAGDDLKFEKTSVFCEDKAYSDAAVLALIHLKVPYHIVKTQSFSMRDETLTATEVILKNRSVLKFDDKPAAEAYAEALGVNRDALDDKLLTSHPLGLSVGNTPYVRSPQQVLDNQEVKFYCRVEQGSQLRVLYNTDIVGDTKKAIDQTEFNLGRPIGAMVVFNCILRHLEMESRGITRDFVASFGARHFVGFSTYGEQYVGHVNQTAIVLCLAKP